MEESEKRRERLKAMRMEAAQSGADNEVGNSSQTQGLPNPLLQTAVTNQESCPQRFGYYTDPMAAFSGNKRSKVSQNITQEHLTPSIQEITPRPLPSQGMYQQQESVWSPTGMVRPSSMQPGTPRGAWNGPGPTYGYNIPPSSPIRANFPNTMGSGSGQGSRPINYTHQGQGQWSANSPRPGPWLANSPSPISEQGVRPGVGEYQGGPGFNPIEGRGSVRGGNPGFGQGGRGSYDSSGQGRGYWSNNSPNPSQVRGSNPGFGQGFRPNYNPAQGRGDWSRNSHNPGTGYRPKLGRGGGQWSGNNASPGPARSGGRGGRGRGSHDNVSAELRPDLYYNKSMVEDPWKFLTPIIWITEKSPSKTCTSSKSWLPKSISMQGAKASTASTESNKSQPSLAEYLAASFNDAVKNDESMI
ncbi:hypothetical protein DCAR_0726936 [Daucus carota subsp. sativus]|uniref:Uncharacterized protein n=1 Tax=Daucus carota subsp. sativus TaxID=79200 RepID=A0A161WPW3_DAUCS|nr:PREDICTED: translation initiation factor IF-2-like [Daucus carota subsp. sativus]WOH07506.1 hypothetical protein DCAR_0726936 [Daucus carota subsp. sativus]